MRFTCDQALAAEAFDSLSAVATTRGGPSPVTLNVRIVADKAGAVTLYATNLDRSLRYVLPGATIEKAGEVLVPAKKLADTVRVLDKTVPMQIEATKDGAVVKSGRAKFTLRAHDVADFPTLPEFDPAESFELPAKDLVYMAGMVAFAVATDAMRFSLHGVLFEIRKDALTLVGSDGKRLAMVSHPYPIGRDVPWHVIVPRKGLDIITFAAKQAATVRVLVRESQMIVKTDRAVVSTQLVAGLYPAFRQVLPDESKFDKRAVLNVEAFTAALRRAEQFTGDDARTVRFAFATNKLTMRSRNPDEGEAEVEMEVGYVGEDFEIGFDPAYVLDMLKVVDGPDVTLAMKDDESPGMMHQGRDGFTFAHLVMPADVGA